MKLELTAKEVKSIGERRAMATLNKKYMPWAICGLVALFMGLLAAIAGSEIGSWFVALVVFVMLIMFIMYYWEAHIKGYEFLDSVIKGNIDKEQ